MAFDDFICDNDEKVASRLQNISILGHSAKTIPYL